MRAGELQRFLTEMSGYQPGEIDQRIRPLRGHDLIPHGPRGFGAPELEPDHVAMCLLSMVSRRASDAGPVAIRAAALGMVGREGTASFGPPGTALRIFLASGLGSGSSSLRRVEVRSDGGLAWLEACADNGVWHRLLFTDNSEMVRHVARFPEAYDAQGGSHCGHWLILRGALFDQLILEMASNDESDSGWGVPPEYRGRELRKIAG